VSARGGGVALAVSPAWLSEWTRAVLNGLSELGRALVEQKLDALGLPLAGGR
jgi:hypothetical protein